MQLIKDASSQKLRGAYYTPRPIADFIIQWGMCGNTQMDILEPSCGDGVFLESIAQMGEGFKHVVGVEYEACEAAKAREVAPRAGEVKNMDFHRFCLDTEERFDLVVGNPPFIRYQYYNEEQQKLADLIFKKAGLKRTKLTNAWVTFVVGSSLLLKENGKMGFVIPSELLMVKYAKQLRQYLASHFNKINIISFENLVFEEIQQEVVLLLCEKNGTKDHLIEHIEVRDTEGLKTLNPQRLRFPTKHIDFHTDKWTYYFLDKEELDLLEKVRESHMPAISHYADVEVGITTGSNDYFTVPQSVVNMYQLQKYARPMVGRSVQVNSLCFTPQDWRKNVESDAKANLLVFSSEASTDPNEGVRAYLENGERQGIDKGYKTSIRDYWYVIPSIKLSDALFLRRNNLYPKFVLNEAKAYTTDTMHRVFIHEGINKKAFVASYYNSLSFVFAEIQGRNFGGGCLELMPSEVGGIRLPYREENAAIFDKIDEMLRARKSADEILDYTDGIILQEGYGFSEKEVNMLRSIWHKIMNRRLGRDTMEKSEPKGKKKDMAKPKPKSERVRQLDFFDILRQYPDNIVENNFVCEDIHLHESVERTPQDDTTRNSALTKFLQGDLAKSCLVSLVKKDNFEQYVEQSAKVYYTGKKFPATVALNKLFYFMPYLKGKGIRDLYFIRLARVGTRKEGLPDNDPQDFRLVFEIEFVGQLFADYKPVDLKIWHTFTDTTIGEILHEQ